MQFKLAKKVLSVQLGADVRYFTKYNAPAYMPAIQNFYLQPEEGKVEIGGYPIVNVYAINPRVLKFGLSWNFYD